jgi:hypothetical protein
VCANPSPAQKGDATPRAPAPPKTEVRKHRRCGITAGAARPFIPCVTFTSWRGGQQKSRQQRHPGLASHHPCCFRRQIVCGRLNIPDKGCFLLVIFEEFSFQFCTNVGRVSTNSTNRIFGCRPWPRAAPRLCRVSRRARLPRGRRAAVPRRSRGRAAAQPISATAARRGGIQQPGCAGSQPGAQRRGPRLGRRAAALGRRRRGWTHRQTGCSAHDGGVGGAGEGAWRRVGALRRRQRQGCAIRGRAAHRARTRARGASKCG